MLAQFLPDELDRAAFKILYDLWLKQPVDIPAAKLAGHNVFGYLLYLAPGGSGPLVMAALPEPSDEEIHAAFQALSQAPPADGSFAALGDGALLKLLVPVLLKILGGLVTII